MSPERAEPRTRTGSTAALARPTRTDCFLPELRRLGRVDTPSGPSGPILNVNGPGQVRRTASHALTIVCEMLDASSASPITKTYGANLACPLKSRTPR